VLAYTGTSAACSTQTKAQGRRDTSKLVAMPRLGCTCARRWGHATNVHADPIPKKVIKTAVLLHPRHHKTMPHACGTGGINTPFKAAHRVFQVTQQPVPVGLQQQHQLVSVGLLHAPRSEERI
jgi:hypothetical protein